MSKGWAILFLLGLMSRAPAQFNPVQRQAITDTLYTGNLVESDLDGERSSGKNQLVSSLMNHPIAGLGSLEELTANYEGKDPSQILTALATLLDATEGPAPSAGAAITIPDDVPKPLRPSLQRLLLQLQAANATIRKAIEKLSPDERRQIIEGLPRLAIGSSQVKFGFVKLPWPSEKSIAEMLDRVDLKSIFRAAVILTRAVEMETSKLKEIVSKIDLAEPLKLTIDGMPIEIGGRGDDLHNGTNAVLCIDLGGNDRYVGRYGAGVGYAGVLIDLGGDDQYDVSDLSIGAGVLGVGIALDLGGKDRFESDSICFGAGLAGVGILDKRGGFSEFRSQSLAQGFGMQGIGLLIGSTGTDLYLAGAYSQGAAKDAGIGCLFDRSGDDLYRLTNLIPDPRIKGQFLSAGQGYGSGDASCGLLVDARGSDVYVAESKAQGFGMNSGLGALTDREGADTYHLGGQGQACGFSGGEGFLYDRAGDDAYLLRQGNGHGYGHDHGIGMLVDLFGDDIYAGFESRPASATANGIAIFIEAAGNDRYDGPVGMSSAARGAGSLAFFADLAGTDTYGAGLGDGQSKFESDLGVASDHIAPDVATDPGSDPPKPGSKSMPDEARLEEIYNLARIDDPTGLDELIAIGEPALSWLIDKKLERGDPVTVSIVAWVGRQVGGKSEALTVQAIKSPNPEIARAAILASAEAGYPSANGELAAAFKRPELVPAAIRLAGALHSADSVQMLLIHATGTSKVNQRMAIIALAQIADERAYALMETLISSTDLVTRKATIEYAAKFPERAIVTARTLLSGQSERESRSGIEILALIGSPEARSEIGKALLDPRRGVQIQALFALDGNCPKEFRARMIELRQSADPLVKAAAIHVSVGR